MTDYSKYYSSILDLSLNMSISSTAEITVKGYEVTKIVKLKISFYCTVKCL